MIARRVADQAGAQDAGARVAEFGHAPTRPNGPDRHDARIVRVAVIGRAPVLLAVIAGNADHHHAPAVASVFNRVVDGVGLDERHLELLDRAIAPAVILHGDLVVPELEHVGHCFLGAKLIGGVPDHQAGQASAVGDPGDTAAVVGPGQRQPGDDGAVPLVARDRFAVGLAGGEIEMQLICALPDEFGVSQVHPVIHDTDHHALPGRLHPCLPNVQLRTKPVTGGGIAVLERPLRRVKRVVWRLGQRRHFVYRPPPYRVGRQHPWPLAQALGRLQRRRRAASL